MRIQSLRALIGTVVLAGLPLLAHSAFVDLQPAQPPVSLGGGTTSAIDPSLAGLVIADTGGDFFGLNFKGEYQTRVVKRDDTGTLDFYYRITSFNDQDGNRVLRDFRIGDYAGWDTSVTWRPDGLGDLSPLTAIRFPQPGSCPSCNGINFSFSNLATGAPSTFDTGDTSLFMVIRTTATQFGTTNADVYLVNRPGEPFGQHLSNGFSVYAPVPEPYSLSLVLAGLLVVGAVTRTRR